MLLPVAYGIIHALVDATTATVAFTALRVHHVPAALAFNLIVLYDLLAFGSQVFLGALTDRLRSPRHAVLAGLALIVVGVAALPLAPITATVLVGLGNAAFHVGAGAIALRVDPFRATAPGVFVGPGALGLGFGMWFGKSGFGIAWPFAIALAACAVVVSRLPDAPYPRDLTRPTRGRPALAKALPWPKLVIGLLLASVLVRSLIGFAGGHALIKSTWVLVGLPLAAFAGKTLGGVLSDRLGWIETNTAALLLSAPLIAFGGSATAVILGGMFVFQMTMPATLAALSLACPRHPAFAFGLACLALVLGALPTFSAVIRPYYGWGAFLGAILLSAATLYAALRLMADAHAIPSGGDHSKKWARYHVK